MVAKLTVTRPNNFSGAARLMPVWLDGFKLGSIANNSVGEFVVREGIRQVSVSMGWWASQPLAISFRDGDQVDLRADINPHAGPFAIFFAPKSVFRLSRLPPVIRPTC